MSALIDKSGGGIQGSDLYFSLINWGRAHLLEVSDEERQEFQAQTMEAWSSTKDPEAELRAGWNELQVAVRKGVEILSSSATISLDSSWSIDCHCSEWEEKEQEEALSPEEKSREKIANAFFSLDQLLFFIEGLTSFSFPDDKTFPDLQQEANELYDTLVWGLPSWRFIPLNNERKLRLSYIPEVVRDLFPWYEEWSQVPPDTLDKIVFLHAGEKLEMETLASDTLLHLSVNIGNDPPFRQHLRQQALVLKMVQIAMPQAYALHWLLDAESEAGRHPWSKAVHECGGVNASVFVRCKDILTRKDKTEGRFRLAACGIAFSPEDRMAIFHPIEDALKAGQYSTKEGKFFQTLSAWQDDQISGQELLNPIFDAWHRDMNSVASLCMQVSYTRKHLLLLADEDLAESQAILAEVRPLLAPVPCVGDKLFNILLDIAHGAVNQVRGLGQQALDQVGEWIETIELQAAGFTPAVQMAGPEDDAPPQDFFPVQQYCFVTQPAGGALTFLGHVPENPEYEKIRTAILACNHFHWLELHTSSEGERKTNGPYYSDNYNPPTGLPVNSWQGPVFLLIAGSEERLNNLIEILQHGEIAIETVRQFVSDKILLIIYTPPEQT